MKGRLAFVLSVLCAGTILVSVPAARASENLTIVTADGVTLAATYYGAGSEPAPAVVLLHMLGRTRADWQPFADLLTAKGIAALAIDLRGHGESVTQGAKRLDYRDFDEAQFNAMIQDARAAFDWLVSRPEVDKAHIGVVGASIGCNVAVNFAAQEPQVASLVLLSPGLDYRGIQTADAMGSLRGQPVFIAASSEDKFAFQSSQKLAEIGGESVIFVGYENAGHGTQMLDVASGLTDKVISFLTRTLGGS